MRSSFYSSLMLAVAVFVIAPNAQATAPIVSDPGDLLISDAESTDGGGTTGNGVFVYPDAIGLDTIVADTDTPTSEIKWSYTVDTSGNVLIRLNDANPMDIGGGDDPVSPLTNQRIDLNDDTLDVAGNPRDDTAQDSDMRTVTLRNASASPQLPTDGTVSSGTLVTLFASDGTTFGMATIRVYTANTVDGGFELSDSSNSPMTPTLAMTDFRGSAKGWQGRKFAGNNSLGGSISQTALGLCMTVAASGSNGVEWRSPLNAFTIAQRTVYRLRIFMSTDQSTQGSIPVWDVNWINLQNDFFLNYGGRRWFIDTEGGAQGIGLSSGRDFFDVYIAPSPIDTPQWNGEGSFVGHGGAFSTEASAKLGLRLIIRILDFDAGLQASTRSGSVYIEAVQVDSIPLATLTANATEVYNDPISTTTHQPKRGSTTLAPGTTANITGGEYVLRLPSFADTGLSLITATLGPNTAALPDFVFDAGVGASVRNPLKRFPVVAQADTLYQACVAMYATSSESDPVDVIDIVNDAYTIEYGGESWVTTGSEGTTGGMDGAGSPKLLTSTGGMAPDWMDFIYVNNPTASLITNSQRWRLQVDFFNRSDIGIRDPKNDTGGDELRIDKLAVNQIDLLNLP